VSALTTTGAKFVVDNKGRKKAVLLDVKEYTRLLARMEELEDALDLDEGVRTAHDFRDYREVREELVKEGRL
jgi:PHD/YefM family antitoxin component YafN of YafNO toxin-antitoxin module